MIFILNRHLVQTLPTFDIFFLAYFLLTLVFIEEPFQYIRPYSLIMFCKFYSTNKMELISSLRNTAWLIKLFRRLSSARLLDRVHC